MKIMGSVVLAIAGFFLAILAFMVSLGSTLGTIYSGGIYFHLWVDIFKFLLPAICCTSISSWLIFNYK